jgi:hypothetical protein
VPTEEEGGGKTPSVSPLPPKHLDVEDHAEKRASVEQCFTSTSHDTALKRAMAKGTGVRQTIKMLKEEAEGKPEMPSARVIDILRTLHDLSYDVERTRREVHIEIRAQNQEKERKMKNNMAETIVQEKDPVGIDPNYDLARKMIARDEAKRRVSLMRFYVMPSEDFETATVPDADLPEIVEILEGWRAKFRILVQTRECRERRVTQITTKLTEDQLMTRRYRYTKQEAKEARKAIMLRVVMNKGLSETPAEKGMFDEEFERAICPSAKEKGMMLVDDTQGDDDRREGRTQDEYIPSNARTAELRTITRKKLRELQRRTRHEQLNTQQYLSSLHALNDVLRTFMDEVETSLEACLQKNGKVTAETFKTVVSRALDRGKVGRRNRQNDQKELRQQPHNPVPTEELRSAQGEGMNTKKPRGRGGQGRKEKRAMLQGCKEGKTSTRQENDDEDDRSKGRRNEGQRKRQREQQKTTVRTPNRKEETRTEGQKRHRRRTTLGTGIERRADTDCDSEESFNNHARQGSAGENDLDPSQPARNEGHSRDKEVKVNTDCDSEESFNDHARQNTDCESEESFNDHARQGSAGERDLDPSQPARNGDQSIISTSSEEEANGGVYEEGIHDHARQGSAGERDLYPSQPARNGDHSNDHNLDHAKLRHTMTWRNETSTLTEPGVRWTKQKALLHWGIHAEERDGEEEWKDDTMETRDGTIYFSWKEDAAPGPRCRVASISQESRQRGLIQAQGGLRGGMLQPDPSASDEEDEESEVETYVEEDGKIIWNTEEFINTARIMKEAAKLSRVARDRLSAWLERIKTEDPPNRGRSWLRRPMKGK